MRLVKEAAEVLDSHISHTKVGCHAESQEEVEDGQLDPIYAFISLGLLRSREQKQGGGPYESQQCRFLSQGF